MNKLVSRFRKEILKVACKHNKGHIAPSLSCLDILVVLFYSDKFSKDSIILSKGHGCYGLYAILADLKVIDKKKWLNFDLPGCYEGFGSLGHGLPVATGVAFAKKLMRKQGHVYVIVGDGEMQEGSNWEALSFIKHHNLDNITVIVDSNGLQAMDWIDKILSHNLFERFYGFGFQAEECDGHDVKELEACLSRKSNIIIAHTTKGKGVGCMENVPKFHYRVPDDRQRQCN